MKKVFLFILILLLGVFLFGCQNSQNGGNKEPAANDEADKKAVASLVENFGKKLQMVSLLAPSDIVRQSMQDNYGTLVTPALLEKWQNDPQNAPGRMVSSPWLDRIEILTNEKSAEGSYEVKGEIIEITSVEQSSGGVAAKRPITLSVKKIGNSWLIDNVTLGPYAEAESIIYNNTQYGFTFTLPKSWKNYSIVTDKWEGIAIAGPQSGQVVETGQIIKIRHPEWTSQNPRQDIPIMIFTLAQWDSLRNEEFSVGAAPIAPSELGRNSKYVFALPARYNYAFPEGFKEVEDILAGNPLQPTEYIK
ncbi:MAG TPA: hypothetical protein VN374_03525 [Desulfitobacteriaceae bacterium]|nr:hypothetical protein [Desulfitobacteriaceae bacterium]